MRYFATPSHPAVREAMSGGLIGCITTPAQGNRIPDGAEWVADNGCFGKGYPGPDAWLRWLSRKPNRELCRFANAPDVVGDPVATLEHSEPWLAEVRDLGIPAALVAQNGILDHPVPWTAFDALFLGGIVECPDHGPRLAATDNGYTGSARRYFCDVCGVEVLEWKLGPECRGVTTEAKRRGKWVHMGRVSSRKRLHYAREIGCDSADGTFLKYGVDKNLPQLLDWLQPTLFDEAAP